MKNDSAYKKFKEIADFFVNDFPDVEHGKMMSAEAIVIQKKVIAFYYKSEMCFRLGKDFEIESLKPSSWHYLNPFKNKPPMIAWFCISDKDIQLWDNLCQKAYDFTRKL